jgi:hypothetical protein
MVGDIDGLKEGKVRANLKKTKSVALKGRAAFAALPVINFKDDITARPGGKIQPHCSGLLDTGWLLPG